MRLDFDNEQVAVRDAISACLKRATRDRLREIWGRGYLDEEFRDLGEMGMFTFVAGEPPDEADPARTGAVESCILAEQLGLHAALTPILTSVVQVAGAVREENRYADSFAQLVTGQKIWSWAHLEAPYRPNAAPSVEGTMAQGQLVLSGEKAFVEWGDQAEQFLVSAMVSGQVNLVVVPAELAGVTVFPRRTNTGGSITGVRLRGASVPVESVLASGESAARLILDAWKRTLLFQSAYLAGIGRRAIELTVDHAKVREQFGRPLGAFQAVKHALADAHVACLASHLLVFEAASRQGFSSPLPALASMKAWIAEATTQSLRVAHEIHGGLGAVDDHEVSLLFRRALSETQLYGSASELWQLSAEARADQEARYRRSTPHITQPRRENIHAARS